MTSPVPVRALRHRKGEGAQDGSQRAFQEEIHVDENICHTAGAWILNAHGHRYPMLARKFSGCIRSVTYVYDTEDC